ncbi:MAG TPA: type II secretion system protein [Verrucomicrobiae bacterium]|nr:type II secretion system protein [Verrucomicrobiae bacterium]
MARIELSDKRKRGAAFTLAEVVVSVAILASVMAGLIYGYIQINYRAQLSSMSLAAQSLAAQSVEQARAAKWDVHSQTPGTGPGSSDELPPTNYVQIFTNSIVVPATGKGVSVTNYVSVTDAYTNPPIRGIRSDCVWRAPFSGKWFTNTVITYRISDE